MEHAYEEASVEAFHEWRKSVKYLWHQLEVLTPTWETVLIPYADALHDLSDYLGEDHDYAVLKAKLLELPPEISNGDTIYLLVQLINSHREQLERSAQDIGERLYAEKPKCFVRRHHHYWRAWRHEHATD
jgi:CHAD domain-containing protein